jgi:hypothetical protein
MTGHPAIDQFLDRIRSEGRSSPSGQHWQRFWNWLAERAPTGAVKPPVPLILAAAGESDAVKHSRLGAQLVFAHEHGLAAEAIDWLASLAPDHWNRGSAATWHRSNHAWD